VKKGMGGNSDQPPPPAALTRPEPSQDQ